MIRLLLALFFFTSAASASEISLQQVIELRGALGALDGFQKEIPQGREPAKVVLVAYKFSGDTRWKLFSALTALKPALDTFDAARADLQKRAKLAASDAAATAALESEMIELLVRKVKVDLPGLSREDLALADNPIPGTVLAALAPLLKE